MIVTSESACNRPADSSVWWSSTNNPLARTFTLRILRTIGSSHCFFFRSIAFNSWMVFCRPDFHCEVNTFQGRDFQFAKHGGHGELRICFLVDDVVAPILKPWNLDVVLVIFLEVRHCLWCLVGTLLSRTWPWDISWWSVIKLPTFKLLNCIEFQRLLLPSW